MNPGQFGPENRSRREPAGDLWRHTLARIPTLFGRMLYLSSLRNKSDGAYQHPGLAQMVGDEEAGQTLLRSHTRVFQDWLCLNLEQQKADLEEYLAETANPAATLADWTATAEYKGWAPSTAQEVECRLFVGDLETLFAVLKREYGAASPDPGS
ncbi:MAG TPA: hypothetical protein VMG35_00520 [Bryobacteraceae bacterium]|nr:hypothetical protein [Bryobacteraceae bacterium]